MKPRIYTDASVIGGCFDKEFESASRQLIESVKTGEAIIVVSDLTLLELELAPVRKYMSRGVTIASINTCYRSL